MKTSLWRSLAAQTRLGTAVPEALDRVAPRDPQAARLAAALRRGSTLADAVQKEALPAPVVAAVRVAEAAGDLPRGLDELADIVEEAEAREASWRLALAYPQVLGVAVVGLFLVIGFVIQSYSATMSPYQFSRPGFEGWVLAVVRAVWTPTMGIVAVAALVVAHLGLRLEAVRLRLPSIGEWLMRLQMVTWLRWVDWLTARGVPLAEAVHTAAEACASPTCRSLLQRVAARVEQGTSLSRALDAEPLVPGFVGWLVAHAERAEFRGHLLARAATAIERDARATERSFFPLAEHMAVAVIGLGTAFMVLSFHLEFWQVWGYIW